MNMINETNSHIYFWGSEFSNPFYCEFQLDSNYLFSNSEQAFMYKKALEFDNFEIAEKILRTPTPKICKGLGREIKNFDVKIWDEVCYEVMKEVNLAKWSQNPDLEKLLINTGNKVLVEGSPFDDIWGVKLRYDDPLILDERNWNGKNYLL